MPKTHDQTAAADSAAAPAFVHLHVHTEYSLLDGACRIGDLVKKAKQFGMPAITISDHGNMFGAIEFYAAAKAAGVKPIIGCELYLAPGDRRDKEAKGLREASYHQLLLAMDLTGYRNLIKLASIGYVEGFYYKPRIDKAVLREFSAGLICSSTCLGAEIPQTILKKESLAEAKRVAEEYLSIFGPERFFIELQDHGLPEQKKVNPALVDLAHKLGVGTIATNDVHYLNADDTEAHDVLCCISTRSRVAETERFKFESDQFYLKTGEEMLAALPEHREAIENTLRVAEMCNVEFDFSKRYAPVYRPPAEKSADEYLRELVYAGAAKKYGGKVGKWEGGNGESQGFDGNPSNGQPITLSRDSNSADALPTFPPSHLPTELLERIDYELSVISSKGFSGYFLIVWDFVRFAHENGIPAVARGSGCSTVVGYCLDISTVDPIRYGLYFERFMDPERDEMPDIDVDLCQDRRGEVIDYVRRKYGHVAQIITFGRLKAKAAIRDICRTLDVPLAEADRVAKLVPEELKMTLDKALEREPELQRIYKQDERMRKVIDIGRRLEGLARHASVHAAGVVIADQPLDTLVPLHKPADSEDVTTQFEGPTVEKVGLLKMDFLGLRTLSQINLACKLVEKHHRRKIDLDALDLTDQKVYEILQHGQTRGIFQFESGGMRDVLMKMKPNRIEDLIAANALFRPGPMEYIDEYVARKHGRKKWDTPHPTMTDVLKETYGIMVYQEQVSRLVNRLGDVPLRRAFRLAKAISKKKTSDIDKERGPFIEGAGKNGVRKETAEQIFEDILKFGGYAFNKAHSTGYAVVAFQTAYLKTYYPVEFMAAMLTYESSNTDKIAEYIDECRRLRQQDGSVGIPVLPPDVNESDEAFTVVYPDGANVGTWECGKGAGVSPSHLPTLPPSHAARRGVIRFGLSAISGVGEKAVRAIRAAREKGGRFRDLYDFCERVDLSAVNKAVIEALIKSGAFDSTGAMRRALMLVLEKAIEAGQESQRDLRAGQLSMFGDWGTPAGAGAAARGGAKPGAAGKAIGAEEWSDSEMLAYEKATLGFYITKHPLAQYEDLIRRYGSVDTSQLAQMPDGARILLGGLVSKTRTVPIKTGRSAGKKMLLATIEDFAGTIEIIVFPDQLEALGPLLKPDAVVFVEGGVDRRREEPSIRTARVIPIEDAQRELSRAVVLRFQSTGGPNPRLVELRSLAAAHVGGVPLVFEVETTEGFVATLQSRIGNIDPSAAFVKQVEALLGEGCVRCYGPKGV